MSRKGSIKIKINIFVFFMFPLAVLVFKHGLGDEKRPNL